VSNRHRVFVYGTLKKGIHNHRLLENAEFIGRAYTVDGFKMYSVGFPVIRFSDDGDPVYGEVYDVDDETLKRLDHLENEGVMYNRKEINVIVEGMDVVDANVSVYVGNDEYWDRQGPDPYERLNSFGELEWRP
jgi:gamma-glutamylcyclotransferase (GGCT)/AIG2-like uncharacterized protein YtfP